MCTVHRAQCKSRHINWMVEMLHFQVTDIEHERWAISNVAYSMCKIYGEENTLTEYRAPQFWFETCYMRIATRVKLKFIVSIILWNDKCEWMNGCIHWLFINGFGLWKSEYWKSNAFSFPFVFFSMFLPFRGGNHLNKCIFDGLKRFNRKWAFNNRDWHRITISFTDLLFIIQDFVE